MTLTVVVTAEENQEEETPRRLSSAETLSSNLSFVSCWITKSGIGRPLLFSLHSILCYTGHWQCQHHFIIIIMLLNISNEETGNQLTTSCCRQKVTASLIHLALATQPCTRACLPCFAPKGMQILNSARSG
jgi:hypothetical protein